LPELPDILIYIEHLQKLLLDQKLENIRINNPFLLRTAEPPLTSLFGQTINGIERLGKRIVFVFPNELFLVLHLMIAGRLHWREPNCKIPGNVGLAAMDFNHGSLLLTEAGTTRRAAIHIFKGRENVQAFSQGGLEILDSDLDRFKGRLRSENHTLKRSLTDPRLFSGIGNSYSDEILHRARLSPLLMSGRMTDDQIEKLYNAIQQVMKEWIERLRTESGDGFPEKVTAFRPEMAVHGKFNQPCPVCGSPVQRIRYAQNETNYCPTCQTEGRVLADRSLSLLLKKDWPRTLEELEERRPSKDNAIIKPDVREEKKHA
jgi:formamidopyrimidine-DNA glycosylase